MKPQSSTDKLRGGYYTPAAVSRFLAQWAVRSPADRVLEPSCGDGSICVPSVERLLALAGSSNTPPGEIVGIELHEEEANKAEVKIRAASRGRVRATVLAADFFAQAESWGVAEPLLAPLQAFDAVIGNPPFVRYQDFLERHRKVAFRLMQAAGLNPNRLTNAWVPFLVVGAKLLRPDGRLAMVIPAELLQVSYAAEIRQFLSDFFAQITLITFRELLFGKVQQNVVLLLADRRAGSFHGIRAIELESAECLTAEGIGVSADCTNELDHSTEKWTRYFLSPKQLGLIRRIEADPRIRSFGEYASVDVGVVTGENDFFVINDETARRLGIAGAMKPLISRTAQLQGVRVDKAEWQKARSDQARVLLFSPADRDPSTLPRKVREYIERGEEQGVHKGYKCRIRKRWYVVPSQWIPDAFALRQVHDYPRIVVNQAQATATDTLHCVRFTNGHEPEVMAAAFVNSLTLAFGEITGRSYGGGVLTFEPSEVEKLPLPLLNVDKLDIEVTDKKVREGVPKEVLNGTDRTLLIEGLGLDKGDVQTLRDAWTTLREKRQTRGRRRGSGRRHVPSGSGHVS